MLGGLIASGCMSLLCYHGENLHEFIMCVMLLLAVKCKGLCFDDGFFPNDRT